SNYLFGVLVERLISNAGSSDRPGRRTRLPASVVRHFLLEAPISNPSRPRGITATMSDVASLADEAVASTPVYDLHTHLYPPAFGKLMLWGIDELLTYHYLIGESMRASAIPYDRFWRMTRPQQADFIWRTLFIERAPLSEACRGVLTVLRRLGLDVTSKDLGAY